MPHRNENWLTRAFPSSVARSVSEVASLLGGSSQLAIVSDVGILIGGETLRIPARVYFDTSAKPWLRLPWEQRLVLSCIYSCHHNGHVREAHLRNIIQADVPWVAPYVVQLIGEYVIEILQVVEEHIDILRSDTYRTFVGENPVFLTLTRARTISYWNEYYRWHTPRFEDYVGYRLLRALIA